MLKLVLLILGISALFVQCNQVESESSGNIQEEKSTYKRLENSTESSETTQIQCPLCGHIKTENLPTDICVIAYTCDSCHTELFPIKGDCCVYCSYGTHKCPSKQK